MCHPYILLPRAYTVAYRKLAKRYHPDLNPDNPEAEAMFENIVETYETLSDHRKRKKYDATLIHSFDTMGANIKEQDTARITYRCGTGHQFWKFYRGYGTVFRTMSMHKEEYMEGHEPEEDFDEVWNGEYNKLKLYIQLSNLYWGRYFR